MKILFSNEKIFDIDGVYNSQNERIWAANRMEDDAKGGIKRRRKYPQKVMVWLAVCSQGVFPVIIFGDGTLDHVCYINEMLSIMETKSSGIIGRFNKTVGSLISMRELNNGEQRIFLHL